LRTLVIEDEPKLAEALRDGLESEGYQVSVAATGEEGFFLVETQQFELLIRDVMLPGRGGLEILSALRRRGVKTPVLLLTARDSIEDRVQGLDSGGDDYLVKPFAFSELLARVRALLRRGSAESHPDKQEALQLADLALDASTRQVTRAGQPLDLTVREFELLEYLLRNQGRVVSRDMLVRDIWKEPARQTPLDNVIDVHMGRLRRKLDDPFKAKLIQTVRGVGFMLRQEGC
jgi:two-component system copper resistance phosphate regulon response regulator CusR